VDPLHDVEAATAAVEAKFTTRSRVISAQSNEDFEETIDELSEEDKYIKGKGLDPTLHESPRLVNPAFPDPQSAASESAAENIDGTDGGDAAAVKDAADMAAATVHHSARQPRQQGRFTRK
jgi:hypothetical protein